MRYLAWVIGHPERYEADSLRSVKTLIRKNWKRYGYSGHLRVWVEKSNGDPIGGCWIVT